MFIIFCIELYRSMENLVSNVMSECNTADILIVKLSDHSYVDV